MIIDICRRCGKFLGYSGNVEAGAVQYSPGMCLPCLAQDQAENGCPCNVELCPQPGSGTTVQGSDGWVHRVPACSKCGGPADGKRHGKYLCVPCLISLDSEDNTV